MSTPKFLLSIAFVSTGYFISTEANAQSPAVSKGTVAEVPVVTNIVNNPDLAPASTIDEKPHVIDENGEKVYFLTNPGTNQNNSNKQEQQKNEGDLLLPDNKIDGQVRNPE